MPEISHQPVLLTETLDLLNLRDGSHVIDCTLGLGGHSLEILKRIGKSGKLMAFEQDERNLEFAKERLGEFADQIVYVHQNFENLKDAATAHEFKPDAILMDLGLSSPHVDDAQRGFSFKEEGPLDMRFDPRQSLTASKVVNGYKEDRLADIIYEYGEEKRSRPIARAIVEARKLGAIETTTQLAEIIANTAKRKERVHPATQTFQALRIYVNRELEVLEKTLHDAVEVLEKDGRLVVISYHSLEDRITKQTFKYYTQECICPKEIPICQCNFQKKLYILTKKPIIPTGIEVSTNPRSRSAKLRASTRL